MLQVFVLLWRGETRRRATWKKWPALVANRPMRQIVCFVERNPTPVLDGEYARALASYDRLVRLTIPQPTWLPGFNRALVYIHMGRMDDALKTLALVPMSTDNPLVKTSRAGSLLFGSRPMLRVDLMQRSNHAAFQHARHPVRSWRCFSVPRANTKPHSRN